MKKWIKRTILLFSFAMLWVVLNQPIAKAASSDLFLNKLDFQAKINTDGSMQVTENWEIKIEDTNTLYKTFKTDQTKYTKITNVTVTDTSNGMSHLLKKANTWSYHLPKGSYYGGMNEDKLFEIAWGVGLEDKREIRNYQITYLVEGAVAKYADFAELYWQFVGEDFEVNADQITGTITLPNQVEKQEDLKVWGHTEDLNGEIHANNNHQIQFQIDGFRAGRYVEIRTLFPSNQIVSSPRGGTKERLNEVIQEETKWANDANQKRTNKVIGKVIATIIAVVIVAIILFFLIKKMIKDSKKMKNMTKLKPTQEFTYFREIPRQDATPAQAFFTATKRIGQLDSSSLGEVFTATLLDLNLKKCIDFEATKNKKGKEIITIKIVKPFQKEEVGYEDEEKVFNFIKSACGSEEQITTKELEKYIKRKPDDILKLKKEIEEATEKSLYKKELANKAEKEEATKTTGGMIFYIVLIFMSLFFTPILTGMINILVWIVLVILLIITSITGIIISALKLGRINVFTQKGIDEQEKWKGLKKYMEDFSMLDKREIPEIIIWEKFLVYATCFGIADKVLKQLKVVYPNLEENLSVNTYTYMYLMVHTNFSSSFSNSISTAMSTSYSSASGGGGGFSGGGGGGRWPEEVEEVDKPLLPQKLTKGEEKI